MAGGTLLRDAKIFSDNQVAFFALQEEDLTKVESGKRLAYFRNQPGQTLSYSALKAQHDKIMDEAIAHDDMKDELATDSEDEEEPYANRALSGRAVPSVSNKAVRKVFKLVERKAMLLKATKDGPNDHVPVVTMTDFNPRVFPLPRHCLCLVLPLPFAAKTVPFIASSGAFLSSLRRPHDQCAVLRCDQEHGPAICLHSAQRTAVLQPSNQRVGGCRHRRH